MINKGNSAAVDTFFNGLERRDLTTIAPLLAEDVIEFVPLSRSGSPDPEAVYTGKDEVLGYLNGIITNFSRTVLLARKTTSSEDGDIVFLEARGDLIHSASGASYRNVYVFKFEFAGGKIRRIDEYANPVTYAKIVGAPIG